MKSKPHSVFKEALSLPRKKRAMLAERLLDSLEETKDGKELKISDGIERALQEAEEHWQAFKKGQIRGHGLDAVLRSVRKKNKQWAKTRYFGKGNT